MRAIQYFLPNPRHAEMHRIFVNAAPHDAWETARHVDASELPLARLLFSIRTLPDYLAGKTPKTEDHRLGVDQITENKSGFSILLENEGKEVVVGSVGQFWHLNIPFEQVATENFKAFNTPGWGKLAWAISVEPYGNGSTIGFELRTTATDEHSWKLLNRYYHIIGIGSRLIRDSLMSHLEAELGKMAKPAYTKMPLPGDELIPGAVYHLTHHTDIEAPLSVVWQYLMQLGCDRGGWYSIDILDNAGRPSINHQVEKWHNRKIGDKVAATHTQDGFFNVLEVEHEKVFIIGGETRKLNEEIKTTWAFVLQPIGADACRLITRVRMDTQVKWKEWLLGEIIYPPIHALMQRTQLRNIKKLAERDARMRQTEPAAASR